MRSTVARRALGTKRRKRVAKKPVVKVKLSVKGPPGQVLKAVRKIAHGGMERQSAFAQRQA